MEPLTPIVEGRSRTRGADVARLIEDEVVAAGWRVGEGLGSEAMLMERFGVGRAVIREAVRILESRHVARPRPGPGGGLVVTAPERSAVLEHASLYLEYAGFSGLDVLDIMELLETAAVARLAELIDDAGIAQLRAVVADRTEVDDLRVHEPNIEIEIGRLSGNRVLELFVRILINIGRLHGVRPNEAEQQWLHDRDTELIDAIAAGDVLGATRVVRRKMHALRQRHSVHSDRIQADAVKDRNRHG